MLEADVSAFNLKDACGIWEDANEAWDGIIICYDATEENSLLHVEDLLRQCPSARHYWFYFLIFSQVPLATSRYLASYLLASRNWRLQSRQPTLSRQYNSTTPVLSKLPL